MEYGRLSALKVEAKAVSETLGHSSILTRLMACKNFIANRTYILSLNRVKEFFRGYSLGS
jgi:hypothetical protein